MKYVFFDFDGTISNTYDGVCDILKRTFDKFGVDVDETLYSKFIGPPLSETFEKYIGKDRAYEAVGYFRELYVGEKAIYKSKLYDGVKEMLAECNAMSGVTTGVATCKKHEEADHLLEWFGVRDSIEILSGLVYNVRETKAQVLRYALDKYSIQPQDCVMVGDTVYDVEGAEELGIDCILCMWGFGDYQTINNKNVVFRADTPYDVIKFDKDNYAEKRPHREK